MAKKRKKPVKVGFDFDGVVAYNPLRILRLPVMAVASLFSQKKSKEPHFPYPSHPVIKRLWEYAHQTSHFPSHGFTELKELLEGDIEGYLITGRYSFLEDELYDWLEKRNIKHLFKQIHVNMKDEQPHLFKERMLRKLKLDYYVEDNLDIVLHLNSKSEARNPITTEIHWIYNIIDRFATDYPRKHPYLKAFLDDVIKR
jgi:hypothetical protein